MVWPLSVAERVSPRPFPIVAVDATPRCFGLSYSGVCTGDILVEVDPVDGVGLLS